VSGLLDQLAQAGRQLQVHQASQATAANNMANVNTPGYTRQRAELAAAQPATMLGGSFIGRGVELMTVSQARDRFLDSQAAPALANAEFGGREAGVLTSVSSLDPQAPNGVPTMLGRFFASLRELTRNPLDPGARRAVVSASQQLALSFNGTANDLNAARTGADDEVRAQAARASTLASQVAKLNTQVRVAQSSATGAPNDLLDARRKAAEDLVSITGGTILGQDGDLSIQLGTVALVVGERAATLSTRSDPTNNGHLALTATAVDGGQQNISSSVLGGALGGVMRGRDDGIGAALAALDALALELSTTINSVHSVGVALDGSTGRDLFVAGAQNGAAARLSVNAEIGADPSLLAASGNGAPGDNGAALALLATERTTLASGRDPGGTLAGIIEDFGASANRALALRDAAVAVKNNIDALRESAHGVSIDEELIEMTKAQRAYEAVSKTIQAADQMLKSLMDM
jgi:flagellar hook-associated protein 1 FlgK